MVCFRSAAGAAERCRLGPGSWPAGQPDTRSSPRVFPLRFSLRRGATARVKVAEKSHPAFSAASVVAAHVGKKSMYLVLNEI